ncbi:MAG: hypothetical protein PW788_09265 [Micavibrio sp.]|nr:hypothetical protein [Micavibrio sp.]
MSDKTPPDDLSAKFNDPAYNKFHKIWLREADIADDFELGCNWYKKWSRDRDGYKEQNDAPREKFAEDMVTWWDNYLVKATSRLARHIDGIENGKDGLSKEFAAAQLSTITPITEALAKLDDAQIKSGKAIYSALLPLMEDVPAPAPQQKPDALDNGNPFKKGPAV